MIRIAVMTEEDLIVLLREFFPNHEEMPVDRIERLAEFLVENKHGGYYPDE